MTTTIKKVETLAGYPRNGNFTTQSPAYKWELIVNGKSMGYFALKREAVEAAKDYA